MTEKEMVAFIDSLDGKEKATSEEIRTLFNINNTIYPNLKETGTYCSTCTTRVYNRMKKWRDLQKINQD